MIIIGTGLSGLVGSRIAEVLSPRFSFEDLSLDTGVDITNKEIVFARIKSSTASWVFHFAAYTNVDACEKEKDLLEDSLSWKVNVKATDYLTEACRINHKKLLYLSTDYVFDGNKDSYSEDDIPRPQSWYAKTKYEGEKIVGQLGEKGLVVRIANPYKAKNKAKLDFVHKIVETLSLGSTVTSPDDQLFMPTLIDDIAFALVRLVENDVWGVYHVVGSQAVSPYEASQMIAKAYGFDESKILKSSFEKYFAGRAPRPMRAVLKNDKISEFGIKMSSFKEGLEKIRNYRD